MQPNDIALLCTHGFTDVLTLGRQNRSDPYASHLPPSPWLCALPPQRRIGVTGRMDAQGQQVQALNISDVLQALGALQPQPRCVAICLLFSLSNPAHELQLQAAIKQQWPDMQVVCSHAVSSLTGEYERSVATLAACGLRVPDATADTDEVSQPAAPQLAKEMLQSKELALAMALEELANRMQQRLVQDAISSVVREAMDCAAAVFLPDGRMLAQARTLPLLLGSLSPAVAGILQSFPANRLQAGDGLLMNDPWSGGTHLPDLTLLQPVHLNGQPVALLACVLHHQDVGGIAPGSVPTHATDVLQEGLRIPPIQLYRQGQMDHGLLQLLCANSRMPANLRGDLQAQWNALEQGRSELQTLLTQWPDFAAQSQRLLEQAEQATRAALRAAPDGDYHFSDALDGDGISTAAVPLQVTLHKRGDSLCIDLQGCADQTMGPINAARGAVQASISYFARMLTRQRLNNDGCLQPITLHTRAGSIVDPQFPAAINARTNLVKLLANALMGAWAQAVPDSTGAPHAGQAVVLSLGGQWPDGQPWVLTEIIASAAGGSPWAPGGSGISTDVGNARSTPAEILEQQAPIRMEQVSLRSGSGGSGLHPGGDGVVRRYRLLHGSASISYRGERHSIAPQGSSGGLDGQCAQAWIEQVDGRVVPLAAKARAQWQVGEQLVIATAGAGGWGASCHPLLA